MPMPRTDMPHHRTKIHRFLSRKLVGYVAGGRKAAYERKTTGRHKITRPISAIVSALTLMMAPLSMAAEFNLAANAKISPNVEWNTEADKKTLLKQTRQSRYIAQLQERYGHLDGHLKIAIIDHDAIQQELIRQGKSPDDTTSEERILVAQIKRQTGQNLSDEMSYTILKALGHDHPEAFQMRRDDMMERFDHTNEVCVVIPTSPNHSHDSANDYIYLKSPIIYGDLAQMAPATQFTRQEIARYTDYHEIAHCLDERHERALVNGTALMQDKALYTQHLSESFADVLAALFMARDGYLDMAGRRAEFRTVTSFMVGKYLGRIGSQGFPNQYLQNAGAIYTVQRALHATQKWIDDQPAGSLEKMGTQALINTAYKLVEQHALSPTEFNDISAHHMSEEYMKGLQRNAKNDEYWSRRLQFLEQYEAEGEATLRRVFQLDQKTPLPKFDLSKTVQQMGRVEFASKEEKNHAMAQVSRLMSMHLGERPAISANIIDAYIRTADDLRTRLDHVSDPGTAKALRQQLSVMTVAAQQLWSAHPADTLRPNVQPKPASHPAPKHQAR